MTLLARGVDTRDRLVAAAIECIRDLGYIEATTTVIAERAAVSRGALQHHFVSRADLMAAVIDQVTVELSFKFDIPKLAKQSLERRVAAMIDTYWSVFMGPVFFAVLNITLGVRGEPALRKRLEVQLDAARAGYVAIWQELFADLGASDAELSEIFHVAMSTARGFGVLHTFQPHGYWERHRRRLTNMTTNELQAIARRASHR